MLSEATLRSLAIMEPKISMYITVTKISICRLDYKTSVIVS